MASKLDHALALAAKGFKVFPIAPGKKAPPLLNGWPQKATSDPELIRQFWLPVPDANIGIHCEGLIVIDVDVNKGGDDALAYLESTEGLPATLTCRTPTGGRHLFFRASDPVPNSVGSLAGGLDVRSSGGYVVAAGSSVEAGEYAFDHPDTAIADAPDWLVERLRERKAAVGPSPSDAARTAPPPAPDQTLEAARTWLQAQDGAQEGQGGDAKTYAVACGLRDRGVSAAQAFELLGEWNDKCDPPWTPRELMRKVRNAYAYGQNPPGARVALPDDFPVLEPVLTKTSTTRLLSLSEFANREAKSAGYAVKGLLQRASYASIYGAPGEGKTFAALDIAYHVAAGKPWMDRKVHQGPVLYLAYEGTGGLVKRAKALRQKYGTADTPLFITSATYNLRDLKGRAELGELLGQLPAKPVLIVMDTFARALMGGDENSAQDVGAFNGAIAALIENTGACVAVIHHSGKDKSKGARGSSALLGALDTEIEVDGGALSCKKQRDIEITDPIGFKLTPLVVGVDADGDESTSCVVEPAAVQSTDDIPRLGGNYKRGFDVLCSLRPNNEPVSYGEWRDACKEFLGEKNVTARFSDVKRGLQKKGYIVEDANSLITRRCD